MKMSLEEYISKFGGYLKELADRYYYQVTDSSIEYDDLIQEGYLALISGYSNYDDSKSSLSTYAYTTVKYGIINYITKKNSTVWMTPDLIVAAAKLERVRMSYYMKTGNMMSMDEMVQFVIDNFSYLNYRLDEKFVELLLKITKYYNSAYSIDAVMYKNENNRKFDNNDFTIGDSITFDYCLEDVVVQKLFAEEVLDYVQNNFSMKDADIFREKFGFVDNIPKNHNQISAKYGVTRQCINRRYLKILKNVRQKFNN